VLLGLTGAALLALALYARALLGGEASTAKVVAGGLGIGVLATLATALPAGTLHREQTLYSAVQVTERAWADGRVVRELWQNGGSSSAEYAESGAPAHLYATASLDILDPVLARSERVLVLGGAALTLPVAFTERNPDLRVDVVEIDPAVTRLAIEYFAFGRAPRPAIAVHHEDGRLFLRASDDPYDLVYLDVFDHLLTVPWTMVTREALADMASRLAEGGVFAANVLSPLAGPGTDFAEHLRATLDDVFADVRIYQTSTEVERSATQNLVVLASVKPGVLPAAEGYTEAPIATGGRVLTDSWAPVEYLQAKVFAQGLTWN
jgi:predicted membrane-bound spermidine synthase